MSRLWSISVSSLIFGLSYVTVVTPARAASLVNTLRLSGGAIDASGLGTGSNQGRLGYFSDLYYDRHQDVYYALGDRGPGGGVLPYSTRLQKFSLAVNRDTGAISDFRVLQTVLFSRNGQPFNGLNPRLLNGDAGVLGLSHDPEGLVVGSNGNFFVADEYGPSLYEFAPNGTFVRALEVPANLRPIAGTALNYVDGRDRLTQGRQDNRGYEGLTISPNGQKLFAILQDALVTEGLNGQTNDGRVSRNLRIVEFDVASGKSTAQYIYQLDPIATINDRIPGTADDFAATAQGRNIGVSAITAINDREFLVIERDNRGIGVDDPTGKAPVGSKRVYKIDLSGATDVSQVSLVGRNTLPDGVKPVSKQASPLLDIAALLKSSGQVIPEKFEGLAIGPRLTDGSYAILAGTDNDFSVTQNNVGEQTDVRVNGELLPAYLYAFRVSAAELGNFEAQAVPEPTTIAGLTLAALGGGWLKRRARRIS